MAVVSLGVLWVRVYLRKVARAGMELQMMATLPSTALCEVSVRGAFVHFVRSCLLQEGNASCVPGTV